MPHEPAAEPVAPISAAQVVEWSGRRLTLSEWAELRDRVLFSSIPDAISDITRSIVDARRKTYFHALESFTAPPELRASLVDGHTPEQVNAVLGQLSELTGIHLICVWASADVHGFNGHSDFHIEHHDDETIGDLAGDLWAWLTEPADSPLCPADPGPPASWYGRPSARLTTADFAYDDGLHNCALHYQ